MSSRIPIFRLFSAGLANDSPRSRLHADATGLSAHEEADPRDWLARPGRNSLVIQTLSQRRGYAITLLAFDPAGSEDDEI